MSGTTIVQFLAGAVTMGYLVAALFFLRFWRRAQDRLFLAFAGAFCMLALNQAVVALAEIPHEALSWIYLIRLLAYGLIIAAIVHKNLTRE